MNGWSKYIKIIRYYYCRVGADVKDNFMRYLLLLITFMVTLGLAASADVRGDTCGHHDVQAYMPSQCPFVGVNTGLRCMGIPMPNGYAVAGEKYKCSNGHQWVVGR